jgi:formylglycine-generating enzyme required for sulfatase activity
MRAFCRGKLQLDAGDAGEKDREHADIGSEQQHTVEITKDFWLGVHEVTQKQYLAVMGKTPSRFSADGGGLRRVKGWILTTSP